MSATDWSFFFCSEPIRSGDLRLTLAGAVVVLGAGLVATTAGGLEASAVGLPRR